MRSYRVASRLDLHVSYVTSRGDSTPGYMLSLPLVTCRNSYGPTTDARRCELAGIILHRACWPRSTARQPGDAPRRPWGPAAIGAACRCGPLRRLRFDPAACLAQRAAASTRCCALRLAARDGRLSRDRRLVSVSSRPGPPPPTASLWPTAPDSNAQNSRPMARIPPPECAM